MDGPEQGKVFPLPHGDLVVGRNATCAVSLADARVSPAHCGLRVRADQVILAPGGRVSLVTVNDQPLSQTRLLRVGDVLGVGPFRLLLRVAVDEAERRFYPGDTVGAYRIVAELGSGAVGRVFEARDSHERPVALKMLRLRGDWPAKVVEHRRALFRREVQALAAIDHPHVVRSYGSGEQDGVPWLAMELVEGPNLREKLVAGRLPVRQVESIMFQLCSAVAAVHRAGVVHRDLKPANIILAGPDERTVLADFGLAQPLGAPRLEELDPFDAGTVVRVGRQIGTPSYMPPEQTQGTDADMRSDVWSLGAILYELAAGRRPFIGRDVRGVLEAVMKGCPAELPDDVEPHLRSAVYRCLQKKPDWRFPTAVELVEAIHDRRITQLLPVGVEGPPATAIESCPRCLEPLEHPYQCTRCQLPLFRYTDGQAVCVSGFGPRPLPGCGTCGGVISVDDASCDRCGTVFEDLPPSDHYGRARRLTGGGAVVVDIYQQAIDTLDKCPFCEQPYEGRTSCPYCKFSLLAYTAGRVTLELVVGGWHIHCANCGHISVHPDAANCPTCGLNFRSGMFPDGSRFPDSLPDHLRRRIEERRRV